MNDRTATTRPAGDDPDWFLDDPELVVALVHWAMSKGAIIRRDWLGLPPRADGSGEQARLDRERAELYPDEVAAEKSGIGMPLTGLTRNQAAIALRRLGYSNPGQVRNVLHLAAELGQHLTAGHLVSFHGQDGGYDITPARLRAMDGHELVREIIRKHGVDRYPDAPAQYRHTADELGELGEAMMRWYLAKASDMSATVSEAREHDVRKELGDLGLCAYGLAIKLDLDLDVCMAAVVAGENRVFARPGASGEEIARGCANC